MGLLEDNTFVDYGRSLRAEIATSAGQLFAVYLPRAFVEAVGPDDVSLLNQDKASDRNPYFIYYGPVGPNQYVQVVKKCKYSS